MEPDYHAVLLKHKEERYCLVCEDMLPDKYDVRRKYCSDDCARKKYKIDLVPKRYVEGVSPGTIGATAELRVCIDLMEKGYHVFRAVSPSSPCDLVILLPDYRTLRVEVKSVREDIKTGAFYAPKAPVEKYDVICYVTTSHIIYVPDILDW